MVNLLKIRYDHMFATCQRDIREELQVLLRGVDRALAALEAGYTIDEFVLCNAGHVTASIGKRNALLELKPLIEEEK